MPRSSEAIYFEVIISNILNKIIPKSKSQWRFLKYKIWYFDLFLWKGKVSLDPTE